eukprot:CAMPEP_0182509260 /NCGR_PEP_ID=MMETSP1321-20130603/26542_1 /TAXON_ID=91990 /ORGANISM="Bolidomonas sp., Strain RCC1657" /LENGTH=254 /DNA_ID=CAMNT_0024715503 /DNA_START=58 /DNA_END=822 /DNA_ORIENTATION=+
MKTASLLIASALVSCANSFGIFSLSAAPAFKKLVSTGLLEVDPVSSGGFHALEQLASSSDHKTMLLDKIKTLYSEKDNIAGGDGDDEKALREIEALVAFLGSQGKGYDGDLVDGEWSLLYSRNGKKSPGLQKLVGKSEKVKRTFSNFDVSDFSFLNIGYTPRSNGSLKAKVRFKPIGSGFSKSAAGDIVIRRISCDIVGASFKYRRLPTLPLPLRVKGGYLDFVYLDEDMRITRGNRGGLFVHVKPEVLEKMGV